METRSIIRLSWEINPEGNVDRGREARAHARRFWGYGESKFASLLFTLFAPMRHPAFLQYARSKLANLLFTYDLARRLEGTGVTVNALQRASSAA